MYVDDLLVSTPTVLEARALSGEVHSALQAGGFRLTKFSSNHLNALEDIPREDVQEQDKVINDSAVEKVLGLRWDVASDTFRYDTASFSCTSVTRRSMLSDVASLYDPLGLVSPIVLGGKPLFQDATRRKLAWDDLVPEDLAQKWTTWVTSLEQLPELAFERCLIPSTFLGGSAELHHFGDGSLAAYGGASYLRVVSLTGEVKVTLLMAKGRVAPMKANTVPRLELAASVLGVQLDEVLKRELRIELRPSTFWSDSRVALTYIANDSRRFKVFVANRLAFIRRLTEVSQWRHVPTALNPADVVSRGATPLTLPDMWTKGPDFLCLPPEEWPSQAGDVMEETSGLETKKSVVLVTRERCTERAVFRLLATHYSHFYDLCKAVAWWRAFIQWLRSGRAIAPAQVSSCDIDLSERYLVSWAQGEVFAEEIECLRQGKDIKSSSTLCSLSPQLHEDMLCVGGHLSASSLPFSAKHPWILPPQHIISKLILQQYHDRGHLGVEWVAAKLRAKYWIIKAKPALKAIRKHCVTCHKLYSAPAVQKMADLPSDRCTQAGRAFESVGVDLFGPFAVKQGRSVLKRYGCLFTCTRVRAIHIEVLPSLESDSFLNGLLRFAARRGLPSEVSDNGTNFVGAVADLKKEFGKLDRCALVRGARRKSIKWTFNPPHAPHFGGFWERMVRTVRRVFCAVINPSLDELLSTVMCEVECMVNNRPLTRVSDDVSDLGPLTPNHFLMCGENFAWPWAAADSSIHARRRWRQVLALMDMLWKRWLREYIPLLQTRSKWRREKPSLEVGDMVLVSGETTPRGAWLLGRVIEALPGKDGLVRSVKVKTRLGIFHRPVVRLVRMEM